MKIGILGTGTVASTIGTKLVQLGHEVRMGSRTMDNQKAASWAKSNETKASHSTFADAAVFGEIVFNCTSGSHSIEALKLAGEKNMRGKILVDVANPLDFSGGKLSLTVCNTDSLGEQIQRALPKTKVVKALNTVNSDLMVNPSLLNGSHDIFICGNDPSAKSEVTKILGDWFGWKSVVDLGDITAARGQEMLLPFWIRMMGVFKTSHFNFKIVRE